MEAFSIYILLCSDGTYYTGLTTDLKRRVRQHAGGSDHRAYTYSRRPVKLVWHEAVEGKEAAKAREKQVKAMSRRRKEKLITSYPFDDGVNLDAGPSET